jgi:hypothetical protein
MTTEMQPEVFIIESLAFSDEKARRQEGGQISRMLRVFEPMRRTSRGGNLSGRHDSGLAQAG